jgi:energy-coupling factor transport system permease protein
MSVYDLSQSTPFSDDRLDARAWVVWTVATAVLVTTTRNPFYLLILLLAVRLVGLTWGGKTGPFQLPLLRLLLIILLFSTAFNLFFVHLGQTVLFSLPAGWPLIGGPITLDAAVYGAINGFMLFTLLVVFLSFNNVVPGSDLVHLTPRLFHNLGLVTLIALTYVPETRRHWQKIQEAQAIRGHQVRGWRDWRPILIPLLVGGMERAMSLAEAMVARGYGATANVGQSLPAQLLLLLGLGAAFVGWVLSFWLAWPGWLLLGSGVLLLALVVWWLGRNSPQISRYEASRWGRREWLMGATAVIPLLLLLLPWPFLDRSSLAFSPYPQVSLPPFNPLLGFALALLAAPAFLKKRQGLQV